MKRSHVVLTTLACAAMAVLPPAAAAKGGWSRVWSDDFNGRAGTGVDRRAERWP